MTNDYNPEQFKDKLETEAQRKGINRTVVTRFVPRIGTVIVTQDIVDDNDYSDLSYLGSFGRSSQDYAIDAYEGILLGAYTEKQLTLSQNDAKGISDIEQWFIDESDMNDPDVEITFDYETDNAGELKDGWIVAEATVSGWPILKRDLQAVARRDYKQYFYAEGTTEIDEIENNYDRYLGYGDQWSNVELTTTVYLKGIEIGAISYSAESDAEQDYFDELFAEQFAEIDIAKGIEILKAELRAKLALLEVDESN